MLNSLSPKAIGLEAPQHLSEQELPTTNGWPLVGSLPMFLRDPFKFLEQAHTEHGDLYRLDLGFSKLVICNHPRHVQHILRDNAQNYVKGGPLWDTVRSLLGNGLVSSQGEFWLRQRRMMQPQFHRRRLAALTSLMIDAIEEQIQDWESLAQLDGTTDAAQAFNKITMGIIVRTMFGTALSHQEMEDVAGAMSFALDFLLRGMVVDNLPEWMPFPGRQRFQKAINLFDQSVYRIINESRQSERQENHLLAMLLDVVDAETGEGMTDQQLRDEIATIFLAGYETTAIALAWSTYFLAHHPDVQETLQIEVEDVLAGRTPTFDDLPNLAYTRMILQESMRLRPPAWFLPRTAVADDEIDGRPIPAGSEVVSLTYMVHRHPSEWHNPEQFDPDRFSAKQSAERHRFAWTPFGAGQRMCIGREFALMEGQLVLAMLVQRYQFSADKDVKPQLKLSSTLRAKDGIQLQVRHR
ncbi:cytochrome P450 [Chloroflexi bacterium TSY]|nr:cytochrome P450 [Chloroflexi bacterium TSY]